MPAPTGDLAPKLRRGAGLEGEEAGTYACDLGVTYLCLCQLKIWKKTKEITWGDMGAEGRCHLDIISLPLFKAS